MKRFIQNLSVALCLAFGGSAASGQDINNPPIGLNSASSAFTCTAAGVCTLANLPAIIRVVATGVDFTANASDIATITIPLPSGATRFLVNSVRISHASGAMTTGTVGVFTGAGGTGATIAAAQAITVSTASDNTVNNTQSLTLTNAQTETYTAATVFVRTTTGVAQTADVTISYNPLP